MKRVLSCLTLAALLFVASCKKETGPQGPAGTAILSGAGAPAATLGRDGDFYLDLAAMLFYGPKVTGAWGLGVSLKGNANVIVDTFTIDKSVWQYSAVYWFAISSGSSQGYVAKYYDRTEPALTADILDKGLVTIQGLTDAGLQPNTWTNLPFTFMENFNAAYAFNYAYTTEEGKVRIYFFFSKNNGTAPTLSSYTPPGLRVKVAMIAGSAAQEIQKLVKERTAKQLN